MLIERAATLGVGLFLFLLPLAYPLGIGRDYPNHLARVYIQSHVGSDAALARNYTLEWFLVPDLALDLFGLPLAALMSPYIIGGLFNGLMLLLLFTAALALHRRGGGKGTIWPLLVTAVLFNEALRWGFVNFLFACGMALWIVYFWLESEKWHPVRRTAVFSLAQIGLFFAHLLGFMLCGYLILVLEVARFWQAKDLPIFQRCRSFILSMLQFAIPLAMFGFVLFGQSGVGDDTTMYGSIGGKLLAFFSPTSALVPPTSMIILLALLLLIFVALRSELAVVDRQMLPLVIAMGGLCVAMPSMVLGIWGLDFRYPFVALMLAIASVRLRPELRGVGAVRVVVLAVTVSAVIGAVMQFADTDRKQQELRRAFALAVPGSALLVAGEYRVECPACLPTWSNQLHAGALAAIERQMFVPLLFTATSLVAASPDRHDLDVPYGLPISRHALVEGRGRPLPRRGSAHNPRHPYWHSWDRNFDYLLWMREGESTLNDVPGLERLAAGQVFEFYRILKSAQVAPL